KKSRRIVIEEPKMTGWSLVKPDAKSVDETSTHYRIARDIAAGETATLETVMEYIQRQTIRLTDMDAETLAHYTTMGGEISKEAVSELRALAEKRRAVDSIDRRIADNEVKRQALFADQKRLRENLKATPEGSDLSKRYLKTLEEQENTLMELTENTEQLMKDRAKAWAEFTDAVQRVQF